LALDVRLMRDPGLPSWMLVKTMNNGTKYWNFLVAFHSLGLVIICNSGECKAGPVCMFWVLLKFIPKNSATNVL
jgi:hypothetical protein